MGEVPVLLAVDIGNTNVVLGVFSGDSLERAWRLSTRRDMTADEVEVLLRALAGPRLAQVDAAIVASVVPPLTGPVLQAVRQACGVEALEVEPGIRTGLRIRTDNPQELGADRIINAVAVQVRFPGNAIVVDFGTATTLDVVTAEGDYLGGVICPGPKLSAEALSARAARLPRVDLQVPPRVVGRNSVDSIRSGLLHGHAAMIEGLVRRIEQELGRSFQVIATGGLAPVIGPLMERLDAIAPDLTLEGLRVIYARNRAR